MSSNTQCTQYIKVLTKDLKHREYQWKFGLNSIDVFNTENECTSHALYVCEIKDFFKWITLYDNVSWVGYVTIPDDAQTIIMEDKIKTNKVILHEPLIPLVDFIDIAIKYGADIHYDDNDALCRASYHGRLDIVERLIKYGADIHSNNNYALVWTSSNGHLPVVECLIKHGAHINARNDLALRWASKWGHLDVVECLINNGSNIHACNDYAFRLAYENGHSDIVECLVKNGVNGSLLNYYYLCAKAAFYLLFE
jgi:hypothetical protein